METTYAHTTWHVQLGREEEFVERWREWVDWSRREGFEAQALLLRDLCQSSLETRRYPDKQSNSGFSHGYEQK